MQALEVDISSPSVFALAFALASPERRLRLPLRHRLLLPRFLPDAGLPKVRHVYMLGSVFDSHVLHGMRLEGYHGCICIWSFPECVKVLHAICQTEAQNLVPAKCTSSEYTALPSDSNSQKSPSAMRKLKMNDSAVNKASRDAL